MSEDLSRYCTPSEAAKRADITPHYARTLADRGAIKSIRCPLGRLLAKDDVDRWAAERDARKNAPKLATAGGGAQG